MLLTMLPLPLPPPHYVRNNSLLKAWQIRYLKNLQAADLERRRNRQPDTNEMFLAYEVRKTTGTGEALRQPLLMDDELAGAYNLPPPGDNGGDDEEDACYVRGDMLGFVEVTQRPYGLGTNADAGSSAALLAAAAMAGAAAATAAGAAAGGGSDSLSEPPGSSSSFSPKNNNNNRPVLTNLAVRKPFRGCGIGSKLLEACEEHVVSGWKMNEIVLEVEDYNDSGLEFYKRKGYTVLFSDPASRRFDIEGFWLSKVRCRRDIMRKTLERKPPDFLTALRRIRNTISL